MKVYVAARYKGAENKHEIEALCAAVRHAGLKDFCFIRDVEHYRHAFDDPRELWERARDEVGACDSLLVDVSDYPTGGRLVEAGIAYAMRKPVIVVKRQGADYKPLFDGIASTIIEYVDHKDLTRQLRQYDKDVNFTVTDKTGLLAILLLFGAAISWGVAQIFIPLGAVAAILYWFVVRWALPSMKVFDRVVIYIPLVLVWVAGFYLFMPVYMPLALAWLVCFWIVTLFIVKKLKFSL